MLLGQISSSPITGIHTAALPITVGYWTISGEKIECLKKTTKVIGKKCLG